MRKISLSSIKDKLFHVKVKMLSKLTGANKKIPLAHAVTAVLGGLISYWAIQSHYAITGGAGKLVCDMGTVVNCSRVLGSEYGDIMGIPLGFFGLAFWTAALALAFAPLLRKVKFLKVEESVMAPLRLALASAGLAVAVLLAVLAFGVIGAVCQICESTQILLVVYFILSFLAFRKTGRTVAADDKKYLARAGGLIAAVAIIPMVIGALLFFAPDTHVSSVEISKVMEKDAVYKDTGNHSLGSADAGIVITLFTDFECEWCRRLHGLLFSEIKKLGPQKVRVVFRNFPLDMHPHSRDLAVAARCAGKIGKFWEFSDWAFETAGKVRTPGESDRYFSKNGLAEKLESLGMKREECLPCLENKEYLAKIADDIKVGIASGVTGTPHMLINGKPLRGQWIRPGDIRRGIKVTLGMMPAGEKDSPLVINIERHPILRRIIPFLSFFLPDVAKNTVDLNNDGKIDHYSYSIKSLNMMVIMFADNNYDGRVDRMIWTRGDINNPNNTNVVYSEKLTGSSRQLLWYGPGNVILVGKEDLDENGTMETTVYFNNSAVEGNPHKIVARREIDSNMDGKTEIWLYPENRMEIDTNGDGKPDMISTDQKQMEANMDLFANKESREKYSGRPCGEGESWALHPEIITDPMYKATIPYSLKPKELNPPKFDFSKPKRTDGKVPPHGMTGKVKPGANHFQ